MENNEPTLLFFPTKKETRKWAAYHNADLSWEERNLIESYLKKGEIKLICATTTLAMGINLPFKNVILSSDKYVSDDGDYKNSYRTSLSLADVENMGEKAGRLNWGKDEFGRVIFLADSLFSETVLQNVYFKLMKENKKIPREVINEDGELYIPSLKSKSHQLYRPIKKEKDFTTFLLAQHPKQAMNCNELLDKLWKDEEDAIYNRVSFHISKVRRTILKIIEIKSR
jgi:helicase